MIDKLVFACVVIGFYESSNYSWTTMFKNKSPEEIHDAVKSQIDIFLKNPEYEVRDITVHTNHYGFEEEEFLDNYYDIIMDGLYD